MKRSVKLGLWALAAGASAVFSLIVYMPLLLILLIPDLIGCVYLHRDLGVSKLGDKVTSQEEVCDGLGASEFMTISLAEAHGGNHGTIFSYEPYYGMSHANDPPPRAAWIADNIVVISVDRVAAIHVQHPALGRDIVRYRIGAISQR